MLQVLAMCFIRKGLDWVFTQTELKWLDDIMPELHKREKEDISKQKEQEEVMLHTIKFLKIRTPEKFAVIILKFEQMRNVSKSCRRNSKQCGPRSDCSSRPICPKTYKQLWYMWYLSDLKGAPWNGP